MITIRLAVKTRGNSKPSGKPRIYLSCHPQDAVDSISVFSKDIFPLFNCAIYYNCDTAKPSSESGHVEEAENIRAQDPEEWEALLLEMGLFLVPITHRFLSEPSRARDLECAYAARRHIPILPVMMEKGLEKKFADTMNRVSPGLGLLQYLDRAMEDPTQELTYPERLRNRLEQIFVPKELYERVRGAFSSRIFLSYRKKDRACARALISGIHALCDFRDVEIWYDEYLVPGEAWDEEIEEEIRNSQLVLLAVTPGLLEAGNYIIREEYPAARRLEKPILAVCPRPMREEPRPEDFPGLDEVVDGTDAQALAEALFQALPDLRGRGEVSRERSYLLGLAYLGGIGVESDAALALSFMTAAANQGSPEAAGKLASMYLEGNGVEPDPKQAICWYRRLLALEQASFQQSGAGEDGERLTNAYLQLADLLENQRRFPEAEAVCGEAVSHARRLYAQYPDTRYGRSLLSCYRRAGHIARKENRSETARGYFLKGLALAEELRKNDDTFDDREDKLLCQSSLGILAEEAGDLGEAIRRQQEALHVARELAGRDDSLKYKKYILYGYYHLGILAEKKGDWDQAKECYVKNINLANELIREFYQDKELLIYLLSAYYNMGRTTMQDGNLELAGLCYERALELCQIWEERDASLSAQLEKIHCHTFLGELAEKRGEYEEAQTHYGKALELAEMWENLVGREYAGREKDDLYERMGNLKLRSGLYAEAEAWYEMSLQGREELAESKTIVARRDLLAGYYNMGRVSWAQEDLAAAAIWYDYAREIAEELAQETDEVGYLRNLSLCYSSLGRVYAALGNYEQADRLLERAIGVLRPMPGRTGEQEYQEEVEELEEWRREILRRRVDGLLDNQ